MTLALRPYQAAAAKAVGKLLAEKPDARAVVAMATGSGKTALGLSIASLVGRTLWIGHTDELIEQPLRAWRACFSGEAGVVKAEQKAWAAKDLVIACIDTLAQPTRLAEVVAGHGNGAGPFKLIVVDECHHCLQDNSYGRVLEAFPGVPVAGLTATPERTDKKPLGKVFVDGIVFRYPIRTAVAEGYLVPPVARRVVMDDLDLSAVAIAPSGDYDPEALEIALKRANAAAATALAVRDCVRAGRKTAVFTLSVEQAEHTARLAREQHGVRAATVSGKTPLAERRRILRDYADGKLEALASCSVLLEGWDDPPTAALVMARPTRSRPLYVQAAGRVLRPYPGKNDAWIVDLVGAHAALGLVTADDIFEEPEEWDLDGREREPREPKPEDEPDREREKQRLQRFLDLLAGRCEIEGVTVESSVRWLVAVRGQAFALPAGDGGTILVERVAGGAHDGGWQAVLEPKERAAPPVLLCEPTSFELAQTVGENHARQCGSFRLANRDAGWRKNPASDRIRKALDAWHVNRPAELTAGQASDLMTLTIAAAKFRSRRKRPPVVAGGNFWGDV